MLFSCQKIEVKVTMVSNVQAQNPLPLLLMNGHIILKLGGFITIVDCHMLKSSFLSYKRPEGSTDLQFLALSQKPVKGACPWTQGQCIAWTAYSAPSLPGINLYCLITEATGCEKVA